jgi:HEAT repeat protein
VSGSIPALAEMLKDPSGDVRRRVAGVLGSLGPQARSAAPAMIAALEGQDIPTRASILAALGRLGASDGATVPTLLEALDDPSDEIRATAVNALGESIDSHRDAVVPALVKALGDPSETVRFWAGCRLGGSRPHRLVFPHLVESLSRGEPVARRSAAAALAWMCDDPTREPEVIRRAAEALAAALADRDARVRAAAASALWRFGHAGSPAVPALRAALDDPSRSVRDSASATLRVIAADQARR